jgi:hypothetical protein
MLVELNAWRGSFFWALIVRLATELAEEMKVLAE